ncbi:FAD-dependent oxidoreductase [Enhydrobacter sp.]|uniref:FAD-dependent oxidoreductase n=1 Tax=Enhydrobacter sp. TaxID=1894999 RepID=UPI00262DBBB9|nr:FAD-dependent oxidoreductase [Enhydrobacter sp.]
MTKPKTIVILGAGPVGLAAAAHALERGLEPVVLEAGPQAAHAVRQWGHVRMFSPWQYNIDKAAERLLEATGWNAPVPGDYPDGDELVERYLEPLATRTPLKDRIRTGSLVTAVGRSGFDKMKSNGRAFEPFTIRYLNGKGSEQLKADAVIDSTGTWFWPSPAGADGLPAVGEKELHERIAYGMPDVLGRERARYAGRAVAVLGAGHSAVGVLIDLARLKEEVPGTQIMWLLRGDKPEKAFGGGANDKLAARGALGQAFAKLVATGVICVESSFRVSHLSREGDKIRIGAGGTCCGRHVLADELVVATGFRPDFDFLREVRLSLDPAVECPPALAPLIDPNIHSCGTVRPHGARELGQPEPGFYLAGMKSYGRAPTFLMMTGYEQVRSIVAEIAGDHEAAAKVELVLSETGVCSGPGPSLAAKEKDCCGGPAPAKAEGCCVADVEARAAGRSGCGCA